MSITGVYIVSQEKQKAVEKVMSLGSRLYKLREDRKIALQVVADAVGASKAHIWELEKERKTNPSMALVTRLADFYDVSVAYLVGEDIEAPDADVELAAMFRQASGLHEDEKQLLTDMMQSLIGNLKGRSSD